MYIKKAANFWSIVVNIVDVLFSDKTKSDKETWCEPYPFHEIFV